MRRSPSAINLDKWQKCIQVILRLTKCFSNKKTHKLFCPRNQIVLLKIFYFSDDWPRTPRIFSTSRLARKNFAIKRCFNASEVSRLKFFFLSKTLFVKKLIYCNYNYVTDKIEKNFHFLPCFTYFPLFLATRLRTQAAMVSATHCDLFSRSFNTTTLTPGA